MFSSCFVLYLLFRTLRNCLAANVITAAGSFSNYFASSAGGIRSLRWHLSSRKRPIICIHQFLDVVLAALDVGMVGVTRNEEHCVIVAVW